jgi:large subunit ribosomal protein L5
MVKSLSLIYKEETIPFLKEKFDYKYNEQMPKIVKVDINRRICGGSGGYSLRKTSSASKEVDIFTLELANITGQRPLLNKTRKSIAKFKIREGMVVGMSVTLRREKMYVFLSKLIHFNIPQIRDFRGLDNLKSFDGQGNYHIGLKEQLIFPEISYDDVTTIRGFGISITTTAKTDEEGLSLLRHLGLPFVKH